MLGLTRYQWTVLLAAWLGWGFDLFDAILFNYVAPNCVPTLLGIEIGTPEAKAATLYWTGLLTAMLLVGWAIGGVFFGVLADRIGRKRTMVITMIMYSVGTAACAFAPNLAWLFAFRLLASLGIGGEWAAGAAIVSEVMPEDRRVEAGALLYTAAPVGLLLATLVNQLIAGHWLADSPEVSWRVIFLFGLVPAAVTFAVRHFVKEPERWSERRARVAPARVADLFAADTLGITVRGTLLAAVALVSWWTINGFLPTIAAGLAQATAKASGLDGSGTRALIESWKTQANLSYNLGGLLGTLLLIPIAKHLGRKPMFAMYFLASAMAIFLAAGMDWPPSTRLYLFFFVGLAVFGIFGSFTFYLPELYPTRLRGTGSGFCYNIGRLLASAGPFIVGTIAARGTEHALTAIAWVSIAPLVGLLLVPFVIETRGRTMAD